MISIMIAAAALAGYGGGGLTAHRALITDPVSCGGVVGYAVEDRRRLGGEASVCVGESSSMGWAGAQVGRQGELADLYTAAWLGFGGGLLDTELDGFAPDVGFVYLRPALGLGVPLGIGAIEGSLYAMLPIPVWTGPDATRAGRHTHVGAQLTLLFGDFRRDRRPLARPERPSQPRRPPPPAEPAPVQPEDVQERPLAIPEDAPPPPPR